ncbi:MAG: nucleotide excision repair endonuclease [Bdellovibrionia bacterium]
MSIFDRKFGKNFLKLVPTNPGVYQILDINSQLIYIGKAKNLRRRLGQYRNARRIKKHRKMQKIIRDATQIQFEVCSSNLEAELLETRLIQINRPKWNIAGAFYFLYPLIGMKQCQGMLSFVYTTHPELFEDYLFFGAFRSRGISGEAFFNLMKLLKYVGHIIPRSKSKPQLRVKHSYVYSFRQIPPEWMDIWSAFWKGQSKDALEILVLALIENAGARKTPSTIQEQLNSLKRFWRHEALPLAQALNLSGHSSYPLSQLDRDPVFLRFRHLNKSVRSGQFNCDNLV